jgi:acyl carrier protein
MPEQVVVRDKLTALVDDILKRNGIARPVNVNADLVSQGVTSVDMVQLMLAIEAAFDVAIPQSGITPANFQSVETIASLVNGLVMPMDAAP